MRVLRSQLAKKTYPTGNPNFAVMQAFPAAFGEGNCFWKFLAGFLIHHAYVF